MKSLEARFNIVQKKNPLWSSFICFTEAIKGQKFLRPSINKWFGKLVGKEDYSRSDKLIILDQLEELSNLKRSEGARNRGETEVQGGSVGVEIHPIGQKQEIT